jgi:PKD repeat protein
LQLWKKGLTTVAITALLLGATLPNSSAWAEDSSAPHSTDTLPAVTTELAASPPKIVFDLNQKLTYVNGQRVALEVPAMVVNGRLFVPVRFLSEQLGFGVKYDPTTSNIDISTKKAAMVLNAKTNTGTINGNAVPFSSIGMIEKGKLLLSARTMSDYMNLDIRYDGGAKTVTIESKVPEPPKPENAPPVAQFTTDKKVYRIGEPIRYIDLSYDPDANGYFLQWLGKEDAFFTAGSHQVTLTVKDTFGALSQSFTQTINVSNEVLTTQEEYGFYYGGMGKDPKAIPISMDWFRGKQVLQPLVNEWNRSRKLIVSNSPETFREYGILYQDRINGPYRLFATHINGMKQMAKFQVMLTNPLEVPITVRTTHKGEVVNTSYPEILGTQGLVHWFLQGDADELRTIQPGESIPYFESNPLYPMQGTHFIHDIEVSGDAIVSFLVKDPESADSWEQLPLLARENHVRGTYEASDLRWVFKPSHSEPSRITIGGNEGWVQGVDGMTGAFEQNVGNYGVMYNITIENPGKAAITLVSRGGNFKGTVKMNDEVLLMPKSGILQPGTAYLIQQTTGKENQVQLTVSPPSGSNLPFDILIYPLDDRK